MLRGKDIGPALCDEPYSYWWLVNSHVYGDMKIDELQKKRLLFDSLKKEMLESSDIVVVTI